jgi:integrase
LLKGVTNVHASTGRPAPIRHPITTDIAERLIAHCTDTFDGITLKAAICVALAGFLRVDDFTSSSWSSDSYLTHVSRGSVSFANDSVTLLVPRTKTEQNVSIPMPATNDATCPWSALHTLFDRFPLPCDAPLFGRSHPSAYIDKGGHFTSTFFRNQLHACLVKAGLDPTRFNTHSFRRGAAQVAAAVGLPEEEIKLLGRWKSNSYWKYISPEQDRRLQLAKKVRFATPVAPSSLPGLDGIPGPARSSTRPPP